VLKEHCLRSNAGLFYADGDEFAEALQRLTDDPGLRGALGAAGRRYVEANYRWPVVLERYRALIESAASD
jgi:glycosyltransferase involved in cell wall biosynthesis